MAAFGHVDDDEPDVGIPAAHLFDDGGSAFD
jgi:hypothetical protein